MLLQDFLPASALRMYIKCFRIIHFCFDPTEPIPYKAYPPKPEQTLHFFLKDPFTIVTKDGETLQPPAVLFAAQQTALHKNFFNYDFLNVQIVFQPTAVFQLTGIPATELTNQFVDAILLFPKEIKRTYAALQEANAYADMIRIVETFSSSLIQKAKQEKLLLDAACGQMVRQHGYVSLDWLAGQACYGPKQFKRKFAERVGVNPKTYSKILRLNRAYNIRNCFPNRTWNAIATQCGYSDYQHLAKDYKEYNGMTPAELHTFELDSPENVLGLARNIYRNRFATVF